MPFNAAKLGLFPRNNGRNSASTLAIGMSPQECNPMNNIIYLVGLVVVVLAVLAFFGLR